MSAFSLYWIFTDGRPQIQAIMTSYPANSIGSTHALRLRSELQGNMAGLTAQALLGSLTSRGWLAKSKCALNDRQNQKG